MMAPIFYTNNIRSIEKEIGTIQNIFCIMGFSTNEVKFVVKLKPEILSLDQNH